MMKHIATFAGIAGGNASHRDIIEVNVTGLALEHTTANFCFYKRCTALTAEYRLRLHSINAPYTADFIFDTSLDALSSGMLTGGGCRRDQLPGVGDVDSIRARR
jgi:hypothetical protein